MTKDRSQSLLQTIIRDEAVRRAVSGVLTAFLEVFTKPSPPTAKK
jgi:hypothetical protein